MGSEGVVTYCMGGVRVCGSTFEVDMSVRMCEGEGRYCR